MLHSVSPVSFLMERSVTRQNFEIVARQQQKFPKYDSEKNLQVPQNWTGEGWQEGHQGEAQGGLSLGVVLGGVG